MENESKQLSTLDVVALRNCKDCPKVFKPRSNDRSARCNSCRYKRSRIPCECGQFISRKSKSGICRHCKRVHQIKNAEKEFNIFGVFPASNETAIYLLKDKEAGEVFYVGATKDPIKRCSGLKRKFYKGFTLHLIRNVPDTLSVIEECREIVFQHDHGAILSNLRVPEPSK